VGKRKPKDKNKYLKLFVSILIDVIGMASSFFIVTEIVDIIWAPISAFINYKLYKNKGLSILDGVEELIPFTDVIPTSTINWFVYYYKKR